VKVATERMAAISVDTVIQALPIYCRRSGCQAVYVAQHFHERCARAARWCRPYGRVPAGRMGQGPGVQRCAWIRRHASPHGSPRYRSLVWAKDSCPLRRQHDAWEAADKTQWPGGEGGSWSCAGTPCAGGGDNFDLGTKMAVRILPLNPHFLEVCAAPLCETDMAESTYWPLQSGHTQTQWLSRHRGGKHT
jgi:hypothetical protein